ncbi:hypothetical protein BCR39DRAFT_509939 [Naematelia encephala]|uniref:Cyclic nucleotide-binding domain-containing protein n=1 Tax=Naematelia encephala TaxID=71784 RepID=A0A1Y2BMT2_9TREE|nr:hypothetical protein BCR39DRAFT_509939 [Naematelia encephala]
MYRSSRLLRPLLNTSIQSPSARPLSSLSPAALKLRSAQTTTTTPSLALLVRKRFYAEQPKPQHRGENQHATSTAREEIKGITRDVAEMISGGARIPPNELNTLRGREVSSSVGHKGSVIDDFYGITRGIIEAVPRPAMIFGLAGLLPYLGTAAATVFMAREASIAAQGERTLSGLDLAGSLDLLHNIEHVQITYGAIILSFLGAIHWGFEFAGLGGEVGYRRMAMGVVPVLFAWPTTFLTHGVSLAVQWLGFTGMWLIDQRASTNGWTPPWYATYRFYLSIVVGFSIIATFAGTSYYGAGAGAVSDPKRVSSYKRLDRVRDKNSPSSPGVKEGKKTGTITGDFSLEQNPHGNSFTVLRNVTKDDEEAKAKQEEEKQKNQEQQDKKDEHQQDNSPGGMKSEAKDRTGANQNEQGGKEERPDELKSKPDGAEKTQTKEDGESDSDDEEKKEGEDDGDKEPKDDTKKAEGKQREKNEGGEAGKSQTKKDDPGAKGKAGEENTGKR